MADWAAEASATPSGGASAGGAPTDDIPNRTANISAHLKRIYRKSVLPVEKRYKYDYFYESPLLTDVEFEGTNRCGKDVTDKCMLRQHFGLLV